MAIFQFGNLTKLEHSEEKKTFQEVNNYGNKMLCILRSKTVKLIRVTKLRFPKSGPTLVLKSASLANLSAQSVQLSNVRKEKKFNSLQKKVFRSRSILQLAEFFFKFTANFCPTEVEVISSEREREGEREERRGRRRLEKYEVPPSRP